MEQPSQRRIPCQRTRPTPTGLVHHHQRKSSGPTWYVFPYLHSLVLREPWSCQLFNPPTPQLFNSFHSLELHSASTTFCLLFLASYACFDFHRSPRARQDPRRAARRRRQQSVQLQRETQGMFCRTAPLSFSSNGWPSWNAEGENLHTYNRRVEASPGSLTLDNAQDSPTRSTGQDLAIELARFKHSPDDTQFGRAHTCHHGLDQDPLMSIARHATSHLAAANAMLLQDSVGPHPTASRFSAIAYLGVACRDIKICHCFLQGQRQPRERTFVNGYRPCQQLPAPTRIKKLEYTVSHVIDKLKLLCS